MSDNILKKIFIQDKKILILVSVAIICVLMLAVFGYVEDEKTQTQQEKTDENTISDININERKELENRLKNIISKMEGVENVAVMVVLNSTGENVYATNSKSEKNGDKNSKDSEIVLHQNNDGNDEGLIVSVKSPQISGVAVVCDGGKSSIVKAEITKLITNLFGIGADRVYVGCYSE